MATLDDYMNMKNGSSRGAEAINELLTFAGPKATGGAFRASIMQLPIVMTRSMQESFAMMYGIKAKPDEDPIILLKNMFEGREESKTEEVASEASKVDTSTVEVSSISADEKEELAKLREFKAEADAKKSQIIANLAKARSVQAAARV